MACPRIPSRATARAALRQKRRLSRMWTGPTLPIRPYSRSTCNRVGIYRIELHHYYPAGAREVGPLYLQPDEPAYCVGTHGEGLACTLQDLLSCAVAMLSRVLGQVEVLPYRLRHGPRRGRTPARNNRRHRQRTPLAGSRLAVWPRMPLAVGVRRRAATSAPLYLEAAVAGRDPLSPRRRCRWVKAAVRGPRVVSRRLGVGSFEARHPEVVHPQKMVSYISRTTLIEWKSMT